MFEKEANEYTQNKLVFLEDFDSYQSAYDRYENGVQDAFKDGAEFGYNKAMEELTERLDNAVEIIELMKDLFFDCWQEKGLKAINFEQRVNDFLKGV